MKGKNKMNIFKKINKLLEIEGYFKYHDYHILSTYDKIAYDIYTNTFIDYEDKLTRISIHKKISKNEFEKLYKNNICDCDVGQGRDIQTGNEYNFEEEVNKKYSDYYIEFDSIGYYYDKYYLYTNDCLDERIVFFVDKRFHKKACLQCVKCLGEIGDLYKAFDDIIYENITKAKMIDDICDKQI